MPGPAGNAAPSGRGIEFVLDDGPDATRPSAGPPGRGRLRPLVGVVALAVVVLGAAKLTGSSSSPSPRSTSPAIGPTAAPALALPRDPTACRAGLTCMTIDRVPSQVYQAIFADFPEASGLSGTTVVADGPTRGGMIWFRSVQAVTETSDITIRMTQARSTDRAVATRDPDGIGRVVSTVALRAGRLRVEVVVTSRQASAPPPFATMRDLAADRRLALLH